jgi:nucleoside-diphosphate-sugar epimerase
MSGKVLITGGAGFICSQVADISQARQLPGYEPRTHLDEGLAEPASG